MVQTEQQYICVHHCLLTVLEGKENEITSTREMHANDGYEGEYYLANWSFVESLIDNVINFCDFLDDEGIAESGM